MRNVHALLLCAALVAGLATAGLADDFTAAGSGHWK